MLKLHALRLIKLLELHNRSLATSAILRVSTRRKHAHSNVGTITTRTAVTSQWNFYKRVWTYQRILLKKHRIIFLVHVSELKTLHLLTYSMEQGPSWEADQSSQLTKKFPAFYGTRRFFTILTSARHSFYPEPTPSSPHDPLQLPEDPS
jgi:hypothetical protein